MTAIVSLLLSIADGLIAAFEFLASLIEDIAYMAQLLSQSVSSIPEYLSVFPAPILTLIGTIFTVVVIYKIIGREG